MALPVHQDIWGVSLRCLGFVIGIVVLCWKKCFYSFLFVRREGSCGRLVFVLFCGRFGLRKTRIFRGWKEIESLFGVH